MPENVDRLQNFFLRSAVSDSIISSMKHNQRSASCFEFACPLLSDHRTQEAKQREKYDSTVLYFSDNPPAHPATSPRDKDFLFSNTYKEPDFLRDFYKPVRLGLFYF